LDSRSFVAACSKMETLQLAELPADLKDLPPGGRGTWLLLGRIEDPFGHHWEIGKPLGVLTTDV